MNSETLNNILENHFPIPFFLINTDGELLVSNNQKGNFHMVVDYTVESLDLESIKKETTLLKAINNEHYVIKINPIVEDTFHGYLLTLFHEKDFKSSILAQTKDYQAIIEDFQTIFDNSYDVLYVTDGTGKTLRVSSACKTLWGKSPEELIGKTVFELEEDGIYNPSATIQVLEQKEKIQIIQQTKTGRSLMVTSTPIQDDAGNIKRVVNASRDITEIRELESELEEMKVIVEGYRNQLSNFKVDQSNSLVYRSKVMSELIEILPRIAMVDSTILITGESGVGKEVIVNYIHKHSSRVGSPFIKINCASIPENLLESELFGYEKGAFTSASNKGKAGLFELANEGTLFLDEIGDMSINLQAKLLRVLQEGEIMRIGGTEPIKVDVRIIAATNQSLYNKIKAGEFREDLFYRLNVIPVKIPPLRNRKEDIVPLTQHFLKVYSDRYNMSKVFSKNVLSLFEKYSWPGNVRQLQNMVERLVVTTDSEIISLNDLPSHTLEAVNNNHYNDSRNDNIIIDKIVPIKEAVSRLETKLIKMAAEKHSTLTEIAQLLGVNQSTISRKIEKYNIKL